MTATLSPNATRYEPVRPSIVVRVVMGPMTKVLNPLVCRVAGRRHFFMAGLVHHVGRRSGKRFVTPVGARHHQGTIVIPLTFGNSSDWSRNVVAAGHCAIRTGGTDYDAAGPVLVDTDGASVEVLQAFGHVERLAFRLLGIRQYMVLTATPAPVGDVRR